MVAEKVEPLIWYQEEIGKRFIETENKELEDMLSKLFGYHLVFLGDPGLGPLIHASPISHRILLNPKPKAQADALSSLRGALEAIPIRTDSVDVVVLPHTLEHSARPHEVLRETHRVLIPEGHVIITGFNPISSWGVWHAYKQLTGKMPRQGRMLTPNRIRDWLGLLNFQIIGGRMFYFRPPLGSNGVHQKLEFLEKWGPHCWPFWGGAYTLLAVKRVVPLTPVRVKWQPKKQLWQPAAEGLPKPTTTTIEK